LGCATRSRQAFPNLPIIDHCGSLIDLGPEEMQRRRDALGTLSAALPNAD